MAEAAIQPVKFLFETAFDDQTAAHSAAVTPEDIDAIRQESYNAGFAAAQNETANIIRSIESKVTGFYNQIDLETARLKDDAAALALLAARKLANTLISRQPLAEIEALILEVLDQMSSPPHIIITVNDGLIDDIKTAIENSSAAALSTSKLQFTGSPSIARNDCHIKWADGEITHSTSKIESIIDTIIDSKLPTEPTGGIDLSAAETDDTSQTNDMPPKDISAAQGDQG